MGFQRSTVMYAVISILFVAEFVSSQNLNCTRLTTACPTAEQWSDRGNYFNCTGYKSYVCLLASNAELREGCIFDSKIPAKQTGCPYTKQCDNRTYQPLLVTENKYLLCPPDLSGCPPRNHSGYSILEIYKFPRCQGKNIYEESSVSPYKTPYTVPTIPTARFTKGGVWISMATCIELGVITLLLLIAVIITCRNKIKDGLKNLRAHQPSGDVDNGKSNATHQPAGDVVNGKSNTNLDTEDVIGNIYVEFDEISGNVKDVPSEPKKLISGEERTEVPPPIPPRMYQFTRETSQMSSPGEGIKTESQESPEKFIKFEKNTDSQEVPHLRSCTDSSNDDSDRSHTPMTKRRYTSSHRKLSLSLEKLRIQRPKIPTTILLSLCFRTAEGDSSTEIAKCNSVCYKDPDTKNIEKPLRNVRRMTEKSFTAEKATNEYVKVLEKRLEKSHQEINYLRKMMKSTEIK